jgi:nucleoside-diphosphate-sugar epimerase
MLSDKASSSLIEDGSVRHVLITGATGFIGSRLVTALAGNPEFRIYALVRRAPVHLYPNVTYVYQDLAFPIIAQRLPANLDIVVHLAALVNFDQDNPRQLETALNVNVGGTLRLLAYSRKAGAKLFVYGSTGGVYGSRDGYTDESASHNPMDFYSVTKCQAELNVNYFGQYFPTVVLRYWFPYGLGTPNPIEDLIRRVIQDEPVIVLQSGRPRINPLHVDDAVEATIRCLALSGHHVLNIAGLEKTSFRDIAERCTRILRGPDAKPRLHLIDDSEAHPFHRRDALGCVERAQTVLDWRPRIALEDGLTRYITNLRNALTVSNDRR